MIVLDFAKVLSINDTSGIDMHWCTCMHWRPIDGFETESKIAARHIVELINRFTDKHRYMCHTLSLKGIEDAKMVFPNEKVSKIQKSMTMATDDYKSFVWPG